MSVAGKLYPQAPGVRMRMLIANPKCLPCARRFATLLSWTRWVPSTAPFTHPYGQALVPWMESVDPSHVPGVYSLYRAIHTCLSGRKGHRASSVPGPLLALPWLGMIPPLLSLESWYRMEPGAQLGVKPDPKASTAAPSVSSQPWSGPLAFCFWCWAPVGFVPLFLKPQGDFCFLSWRSMTTIITSSATPLNPWRYSLGQSPPLPHPFWAVVSSPLITVFFPSTSSHPRD